jgi:hypothetical protein
MTETPAASAIPIIRPSTCAGTPEIIVAGGGPSRASGQFFRTRSKFAPIPPEARMTTSASIRKSPVTSRELSAPRATELSARIDPATAVTRPPEISSPSTRWRNPKLIRPASSCARTLWTKGASTPGPVPQVR